MERQFTPLDNAAVQDYVERIGKRLAGYLPGLKVDYRFTVIAGKAGGRTHEPISLPAGYVFVPASLVLAAHDEDEFAGMLAHAMAHIAARHGVRMADHSAVANPNPTTIPLIVMAGWAGLGSGDQASILIPAGLLKFQRTFEFEADRLAVGAMSAAGYDPEALVRYVDREQPLDENPPSRPTALPSHAERIAALKAAIRELPQRDYPQDFMDIQQEVRRSAEAPAKPSPSLHRKPESPPKTPVKIFRARILPAISGLRRLTCKRPHVDTYSQSESEDRRVSNRRIAFSQF